MVVLSFLGVTVILFWLSSLRPFVAPRTASRVSRGPPLSQSPPLPSLPEDYTETGRLHPLPTLSWPGLLHPQRSKTAAANPTPATNRYPPSRAATGIPTLPPRRRQQAPHPRRRRRLPGNVKGGVAGSHRGGRKGDGGRRACGLRGDGAGRACPAATRTERPAARGAGEGAQPAARGRMGGRAADGAGETEGQRGGGQLQ